jgi:hypothetical protein
MISGLISCFFEGLFDVWGIFETYAFVPPDLLQSHESRP